jgi:spore maturation protein CgeB
MQSITKKLLILDGIGGVPLGREMHEAFCAQGVDASYYDCAQLPKISLYGLKSAFAKLINRADKADAFYHLPRLDLAAFKQLIAKEQPTHVLVIGFIYKFLSPKDLQTLKLLQDFKLYLYDTDSCNLYAKRREFMFFLAYELPTYDTIFSFSKVTTRFFKETKNLNAIHFPFGAKPLLTQVQGNQKQEVLFVGSGDLRRIFLLEHIKDKVLIFGNRWDRNRPFISAQLQSKINDTAIWGEALYQQLRDAKIVLNITRSHFYGAETGINLRIFEALAAGCFLLTDYCDEVAELFMIGEEIEVFRSANELKEKVDYYLANPEARKKIAKKGHEKFLQHYTWDARVKTLALLTR